MAPAGCSAASSMATRRQGRAGGPRVKPPSVPPPTRPATGTLATWARRPSGMPTSYDRIADPAGALGRGGPRARCPSVGDETVLDAGCGSGRVTELLIERLPKGAWSPLTSPCRCSMRPADGSRDSATAWRTCRRTSASGSRSIDRSTRSCPRRRSTGCRTTMRSSRISPRRPSRRPARRPVRWLRQHRAVPRGRGLRRPGLRPERPQLPDGRGDGRDSNDRASSTSGHGSRTRRRRSTPPTSSRNSSRPSASRVHLLNLPEEDRKPFVHEVATRMPEPVLDYVRLNITARRRLARPRSLWMTLGGSSTLARSESVACRRRVTRGTEAPLPKSYVRLTHPLVRDTKGGELRQATWDEALDRTVAGLRAALDRHGRRRRRPRSGSSAAPRRPTRSTTRRRSSPGRSWAATTSTAATAPDTPPLSPVWRPCSALVAEPAHIARLKRPT